MNSLTKSAFDLLKVDDPNERLEAEHCYIEMLTFSRSEEIIDMLDQVMAEDWIGFPVWARNLAFRLACLLDQENAQIRRRAAADLRSFGPDWDDEADRLIEEADEIDRRTSSVVHDLR